jgi:hypothetical protein
MYQLTGLALFLNLSVYTKVNVKFKTLSLQIIICKLGVFILSQRRADSLSIYTDCIFSVNSLDDNFFMKMKTRSCSVSSITDAVTNTSMYLRSDVETPPSTGIISTP